MIAFIASAISAYPMYRLLLLTKSRQTVSEYLPEHQGKQGTPTMGGLIILVGVVAALIAQLAMYPLVEDSEIAQAPTIYVAILLLIGFAFIGFADDFVVPRLIKGKRGLGWKQKIAMQVVFAALGAGLLFRWDLGWQFWISLVVILFFANAYNFSDGLDGLAGSLLLTLGLGLAALATHSGASIDVKVLIAALMAAVIPFLFLNAPPAMVFMGDVGALPIGACLGLVIAELLTRGAMANLANGPAVMVLPAIVVSLIMIAELLPVPLQILSVKIRGRRLFTRTPIHHAFEAKGWPETRIVWAFALTQLVLSGAALYAYLRLLEIGAAQPRMDQIYSFRPELGDSK